MSASFSRDQHLRQSRDFEHVRRKGVRMYRTGFIFQITPQPEDRKESLPSARIGIIASRRVGKAHDRNRARRRIREIFRKNQQIIPADHDILVVLRAGILKQTFAEIQQDFLYCLHKYRVPS